tara:strand:- start:143 stop:424 length:282 start_codon:yes stop_codon:yes gene_type:complete
MNDNSKKKHENKMLENGYLNIEVVENNNIIRDKVWTEKDTIEAETQQIADLLGFSSEVEIHENKQDNIKEERKKEEIPEILYQRKKYKGKKKK